MHGSAAVAKARSHGSNAARSDQLEWLARAGMAARGVVYAIVGVLAFKLAAGSGGKAASQEGALQTVAQQPSGKVMLVVITIGLAGYSTWRLTRAVLGHGKAETDDAMGRVTSLASGLVYGVLCVASVKILMGSGSSGKGQADRTADGVLGWPAGRWIVLAAGAIIVAVGLAQGYKGVTRKFCEKTDTGRMSRSARRVFEAVGTFGHLARMVVFGMVGVFCVKAALEFDPDAAVGLDGALAKIANAPSGPVVLGTVALGLLGFAAYSFMDARYRRV